MFLLANVVRAAGMPALPRTGLADNVLIAVGGTMVAVALVAAIVMWRKRG
jgi:LPXTG-motif cell wall-anchored protein